MRTNKLHLQSVNFKSRFVPNKMLEQTFNRAAREKDRFFAHSVETILNDGKDDILELKQGANNSLNLYVNDKIAEAGYTNLNYYGNLGANLINKYVLKSTGLPFYPGKYNNLSKQEIDLIKNDVNVIELLSNNFENCYNYIDNIQDTLNIIKKKLDDNAKRKFLELRSIVFKQ